MAFQYEFLCEFFRISFLYEYSFKNNGLWQVYNIIFYIVQAVIKSLKRLHSTGYVHWDIKPYNILYKKEYDGSLKFWLIDYGIWTKYVDREGEHLMQIKRTKFKGSIEFTSKNWLKKYVPCRKCDLESLILTMLYLFNGQSIFSREHSNTSSTSRISQQLSKREKLSKRAESYGMTMYEYAWKDISNSEHILKFIEEIDKMEFTQKPNYSLLLKL